MKTLNLLTASACLALALVSCKKVEDTPQNQNPTSFQFLKEGFECKYGELADPDSNVYESHEYWTFHKSTSNNSYFANVYIVDPQDTSANENDIYNFHVVSDRILVAEDMPIAILNASVNEVYTLGSYKVTCEAKDVSITVPKGTFNCYRFRIDYNGSPESVFLVDKDFKYPFIKQGEYSSENILYYYNLLN